MFLREGLTFSEAEPGEVIDFLRSRRVRTYVVPADRLHVTADGTGFVLQVMNGGVKDYPLRRAFVLKLLKWFSMPSFQHERLGMETLASVLNDFLLAIRSGDVTVKIENGEALSITSSKYSEILDLDILGLIGPLKVSRISRNDFFTRIYTGITSETEPVAGDVCGLAYNILNSETGFRVLSIRHYVLRYICSNGAISRSAEKEESRIHYGYGKGMLQKFLDEEVAKRNQGAAQIIDKLKQSTGAPAAESMELVSKRLGAVAGRKRARDLLSDVGESPSMFQIANVVSAFGRTLDINRRLQLEQLAGDLMFG